jgi:Protein of unknown function (DUF3047)
MFRIALSLVILLPILVVTAVHGEERDVFLREDFNSLENWTPYTFPKIKEHSIYSILREGDHSYLKAESSASASGIVYRNKFDVYRYPRAKWRWWVSNVYEKGNARTKSGDDYPLRIYIAFEYRPEEAGLYQRARYEAAKLIYGQYPPHSAINYIWASREDEAGILTNPYAEEVKMIVLEKGNRYVRQWRDEEVNILEDYRKAFGTDPPRMATIVIMNDSDNTGEKSTSYLDYIEIFR